MQGHPMTQDIMSRPKCLNILGSLLGGRTVNVLEDQAVKGFRVIPRRPHETPRPPK
jgi:hypothetical protein